MCSFRSLERREVGDVRLEALKVAAPLRLLMTMLHLGPVLLNWACKTQPGLHTTAHTRATRVGFGQHYSGTRATSDLR